MRTIRVRFHENRSRNIFGNISKDEVFYAVLFETKNVVISHQTYDNNEVIDGIEQLLELCFDVPMYHPTQIETNQHLDFDPETGVDCFQNFVIDPVDLLALQGMK